MSDFKTYWLINGKKTTGFETMRRAVLAGETAIEVSAEHQQRASLETERRTRVEASRNEALQRVAAKREHDSSPEGQREAARRTALNNPGGIVSGSMSPLAELDAFLPHKTNLLR